MDKISSWGQTGQCDHVYVQPNFLNKKECDKYISKAFRPGEDVLKQWHKDPNSCWNQLEVNITDDPIVFKLQKHIKKKLNMDLKISRAHIQTWMPTTFSRLHIHNDPRETATWNSCIYLNNDYKGGEHHTSNGIVLKPEPGLLTLFNGEKTYHGVREIKNSYRFNLVFWWET